MRTITLAILLGLTLACDGGDEETGSTDTDTGSDTSDTDTSDTSDTDTSDTDTSDTDTSDTDTDTPSCDTVAAADCGTTDGCATIRGRDVTDADCIDYTADATPYGCMQADGGCGDAETWARATEDGDCVLFSDTCIPDGWLTCDFQDTPECEQP